MAGKRKRGTAAAESWWRRVGTPRAGFRYIGANGRELTSETTLARIRSLVIPPAWTDVHISPDPDRKIQVWGFDAAGRKQYRYSQGHVARQDRKKWRRVLHVAGALPQLRATTNEHLKREELDRQKVLATVVRLICRAYFRAGSERYAVRNRTFGICTLKKKHVEIQQKNLVFAYTGKRSKDQRQVVAATPLVEIIEELLELPGGRLFQYIAEEEERVNGAKSPAQRRRQAGKKGGVRRRSDPSSNVLRTVTAQSVNRYLREVLGERYTSKDLRTFGGTVRAATILADIGPPKNPTEAKRNIALACKLVAAELGNTPSICRKAYIHPAVLEQYEQRRTIETVTSRARRREAVPEEEPVGYYPEEVALIRFLEKYG